MLMATINNVCGAVVVSLPTCERTLADHGGDRMASAKALLELVQILGFRIPHRAREVLA